jgi:GNAT superfamily N-acetyltransferase
MSNPEGAAETRVQLRLATTDDLDTLVALVDPVQALHAEAHPDRFVYPFDPARIRSFFAGHVGQSHEYFPIAFNEDKPLGFLWCRSMNSSENAFKKARRFLLVDQISVLPEAQGVGVGALLMQYVKELADTLEIDEIRLDSWSFNESAHGFFDWAGFEPYRVSFWNRKPRD